jgi:hypothetical protein
VPILCSQQVSYLIQDEDCIMAGTRSPIRDIDPFVRALNTIIFGVIVHYGTMLAVQQQKGDAESCSNLQDHWLPYSLLLHEYWIYLQHSNVLGNPLCQRLDRQYGIALLRSNQWWSIAVSSSSNFKVINVH